MNSRQFFSTRLGRRTAALLWRALALASLALGLIGLALPVLPTVPFVLLAAWAAGKGWPQLELWMLAHPYLGPHIRRWRERRAIPRPAKWLASVAMLCSALIIQWAVPSPWLRIGVPAVMLGVAIWIWRHPES